MVTSKPNTLAKLIPGKLIDTVRNFCATMNWVISCWDNFSVGKGLKLQVNSLKGGKPKVELNLSEGDNVRLRNKPDGSIEVSSEGGAASVTVTGTDGSSAVCTNGITFQSAEDSNVVVNVSDGGDGNVVVKIGVYYK